MLHFYRIQTREMIRDEILKGAADESALVFMSSVDMSSKVGIIKAFNMMAYLVAFSNIVMKL